MNMKSSAAIIATIALAHGGAANAAPVDFTAEEQSLGAMLEAGLMTSSMFQQAAGPPSGPQSLTATGSVAATTWDILLSGSYNGNTVDIRLTSASVGSFSTDPFHDSFGLDTFTTTGSWTYTPTGVGGLDMSFQSQTLFAAGLFDRTVSKKWTKSNRNGVVTITDSGTYFWTLFGLKVFPIIGMAPQTSSWVYPQGEPDRAFASIVLPLEGTFISTNAQLASGPVTGAVEFIPEPSAVSLLPIGAFLLLAWRVLAISGQAGRSQRAPLASRHGCQPADRSSGRHATDIPPPAACRFVD